MARSPVPAKRPVMRSGKRQTKGSLDSVTTSRATPTTAAATASTRGAPAPARSLATYRAKRDFRTSPEPLGGSPRDGQRYFCVQKHLASHLHYDFRLEHRGVLLSWAVPKGPSLNPHDKRLAMMVEDHPYDYGDFEGVIPSGYGAGVVMLWDRGLWRSQDQDIDAALERGELKFELEGVKLKGSWVLVRTSGGYGRRGKDGDSHRDPRGDEQGKESRSWLLIKHRDDWAGEVDIVGFAPLSVKSGGDFADILAQEKSDLWQSDRPARGGVAGGLFEEIIARAAGIRSARERGADAPAPRKTRASRGSPDITKQSGSKTRSGNTQRNGTRAGPDRRTRA